MKGWSCQIAMSTVRPAWGLPGGRQRILPQNEQPDLRRKRHRWKRAHSTQKHFLHKATCTVSLCYVCCQAFLSIMCCQSILCGAQMYSAALFAIVTFSASLDYARIRRTNFAWNANYCVAWTHTQSLDPAFTIVWSPERSDVYLWRHHWNPCFNFEDPEQYVRSRVLCKDPSIYYVKVHLTDSPVRSSVEMLTMLVPDLVTAR